jgi:hypothetical protein
MERANAVYRLLNDMDGTQKIADSGSQGTPEDAAYRIKDGYSRYLAAGAELGWTPKADSWRPVGA